MLLPHPTDCGQLIAAEVIKLFRAMKLAVIDMRGVGLQVHLLESSHSDAAICRSRSIRDLFTSRRPTVNHSRDIQKAGLGAMCMPWMYVFNLFKVFKA